MTANIITKSLPLSFTQDFKPERRLIAQLLQFAKKGGGGTKQEISAETGIPTGDSTGKVEPMIYYAVGMGLILAGKSSRRWKLTLTPLGKVILEEDPYLTEKITVWIVHLMLGRPLIQSDLQRVNNGLVEPWFSLFSLSESRLGRKFTATDFGIFMEERFGVSAKRKKMSSVILGSYDEQSCLGLTKAIEVNNSGEYVRNQAPQGIEFYPVYSAYFFLLWDDFYPNEKQLLVNEVFERTRMLSVMYWNNQNAKPWLDWMVDKGFLQLDRQTGEALALRTTKTIDVIENIYGELI